jgi:surfeit locus 1 family protein
MKIRLWPILLASAFGISILLGLGTWQVNRLAQKEALIASLEDRLQHQPIPLSEALAKQGQGEDIEYLKIIVTGQPDPKNLFRKVTSINGDPGWEIIAPFRTEDVGLVLVDLGAIAENQPLRLPDAPQTIVGIARFHNKGRGFFDNDNDAAKNIWYWWDVPAMLGRLNHIAAVHAAPFVLQKLPQVENEVPTAELPKVELANNHLGYAITWFGLAAALAGVTGFYVFSLRRKAA